MLIMQEHAVMRHVLTVVLHNVRAGQRADAEGLTAHGALALTHAVALTDGTAFARNLMAGRVRRILWHRLVPLMLVTATLHT